MNDDPQPGSICADCGHFAIRHYPDGCHGVTSECTYGGHGTHKARGQCPGFLWRGRRWPRPWMPSPEGLKS